MRARPLEMLVPVAFAAALGLALAAVPACRRDPVSPTPGTPLGPSASPPKAATEPGPAEKTGQAIDQAAEKTEQGAKSAASAVGSALEKSGESIKP